MSVHDDGQPGWTTAVDKIAQEMLRRWVNGKLVVTSLDFKIALRKECATMDPQPNIVQEDVSRFLKRWFLADAKTLGYKFREHKVPTGSPGTVYNEYYFDEKTPVAASDTDVRPDENHPGFKAWVGRAVDRLRKAVGRW